MKKKEKERTEAWDVAQWQSTYLACVKDGFNSQHQKSKTNFKAKTNKERGSGGKKEKTETNFICMSLE